MLELYWFVFRVLKHNYICNACEFVKLLIILTYLTVHKVK